MSDERKSPPITPGSVNPDEYFGTEDPKVLAALNEILSTKAGQEAAAAEDALSIPDKVIRKVQTALVSFIIEAVPNDDDQTSAIQMFAAAEALITQSVYLKIISHFDKAMESLDKEIKTKGLPFEEEMNTKACGLTYALLTMLKAYRERLSKDFKPSEQQLAMAALAVAKRHGKI